VRHEVAHVLDKLGQNIENLGLNTWQLRTLSAVRRCRTAALGGHIDGCDNVGTSAQLYTSCPCIRTYIASLAGRRRLVKMAVGRI
jgi:hypothetical protein